MLTPKQNVRLMAFTLSFLALSVRAEINNLADGSMPLARAFFDSSMLKNNGLDPELAEYLAVGARFTPGYHNVSLKINGDEKGIVPAKINDAGQLCVDKEFLAAAGLFESTKRETCPQLSQYWRNATVNLIPETETIELVVPFEAINPESGRKYSNVQGGNAAMLNYSVFGTHYKYSGDTNDNFQGTLEMGFNSGDWIFRSTQMLSDGSQQGFHQTRSLLTLNAHLPITALWCRVVRSTWQTPALVYRQSMACRLCRIPRSHKTTRAALTLPVSPVARRRG